jgi:hypothetical protein
MFLREVEKDPALKNLLESMLKQDGEKRIFPILVAGGALTTGKKSHRCHYCVSFVIL